MNGVNELFLKQTYITYSYMPMHFLTNANVCLLEGGAFFIKYGSYFVIIYSYYTAVLEN